MASTTEMARRYALVRAAMTDAGYTALVVAGNSEYNLRGYIRYFADWRLFGGTGYVVFPLDRQPIFYLGLGAQAEWAHELLATCETRAVLSKIAGVADGLREIGVAQARIGIVGLNNIMSYGDFKSLQQAVPTAQFEDASGLVDQIWVALSEEGIAEAEEAHVKVARVFDAFRNALAPGRTEREVVGDALRVAAQEGCFEGMIHVSPGERSGTRPATDRLIEPTDTIKMFMEFLTPNGYHAELGGCFSFVPPSPDKQRKFDMTASAIDLAIRSTRPGMTAGDVVEIIRQSYVDAGWEIVGRRLWDFHGQGLNSSLKPLGLPGSTDPIVEGMMINIHPGILTADGFGVSATNNYVVGPNGGRALGDFRHQWHVIEGV